MSGRFRKKQICLNMAHPLVACNETGEVGALRQPRSADLSTGMQLRSVSAASDADRIAPAVLCFPMLNSIRSMHFRYGHFFGETPAAHYGGSKRQLLQSSSRVEHQPARPEPEHCCA